MSSFIIKFENVGSRDNTQRILKKKLHWAMDVVSMNAGQIVADKLTSDKLTVVVIVDDKRDGKTKTHLDILGLEYKAVGSEVKPVRNSVEEIHKLVGEPSGEQPLTGSEKQKLKDRHSR